MNAVNAPFSALTSADAYGPASASCGSTSAVILGLGIVAWLRRCLPMSIGGALLYFVGAFVASAELADRRRPIVVQGRLC